MAVGEGEGDNSGSQVLQAVDRVGGKARLSLLAVGDHPGPSCLELRDGVPHRPLVEGIEACLRNLSSVELGDAFEELARPRDTSDRFSRNRYVAHRLASRKQAVCQGP